jgi:ABC-2 type transport system permease protein
MTLLPLQMLSGGVTPRESMPEFIQQLMLLAPTTHFVAAAQGILYRGADFSLVWQPLCWMLLIGVVLFMLSLRRFRHSLTAV